VDNVQANGHIAYNVRSNDIYITLIKYIAIVTFVGYFEGCNCTVNVYALLDVDFLVPVMYTPIYILIIWKLSPNRLIIFCF
jgi:hypothetical protein